MSKDFNTGWVRVSRGLAGLQEKLQADTEEGKPQGEFQNCIPKGPQISKTPKSSKSQSSYISLKKQRKEGSAETSWGGSLSKKLRDQGLFRMCPQWCSVPGVDSDTCRHSPHTGVRAGYERQDAPITSPTAEITDKSKKLFLRKRKNSLPATEPSRNSCQSWAGGCSFQLCLA